MNTDVRANVYLVASLMAWQRLLLVSQALNYITAQQPQPCYSLWLIVYIKHVSFFWVVLKWMENSVHLADRKTHLWHWYILEDGQWLCMVCTSGGENTSYYKIITVTLHISFSSHCLTVPGTSLCRDQQCRCCYEYPVNNKSLHELENAWLVGGGPI